MAATIKRHLDERKKMASVNKNKEATTVPNTYRLTLCMASVRLGERPN